MKISHILSASVLAGVVLLSTTACFSSDAKKTPANPITSSTSTAAPSDSVTATATPDSTDTAAPENVEPIPDPSMSATTDGEPDFGPEIGADLEAENPDLVLTPEPDPMPTS
jgi:hypothetical protein